ncbi:uncharacterized protein BO88DRAFT_490562 [Aspergillus vadensis CBS 113365]|uniref:Uncharacterized protein n=1 Tax=Aspergillus vadensis (strain CBS 113365 / IMI 142717 / IBT 24658) TaxID=1448311 RepID=A0A319B231_ASPVC|nr:hypothetical protein BO88DRAFT_490562 [Aspergillus vadensis CBS 113365]PYH65761.1 hypothetical protein BO88DRAFT_490562 [Aspergillus vadensis CBS 113365]
MPGLLLTKLGLLIFAGTAVAAATYAFVLPLFWYLYDPKGLRKYLGFSPLSGLTDLRHVYLSACPNALSLDNIKAISDIYGHGTKCIRDLNYVILGGALDAIYPI